MFYADIETYSPEPLTNGVYKYAEHPDFEVLMMSYAFDDDPVDVVFNGDILEALYKAIYLEHEIVAHNAQFERVCLSVDGKYLDPSIFIDTMALAAELGFPRSLKKLAEFLGVEAKDEAGTRLINLFSKPNRKGERNTAETHPAEWAAFVEYCKQDVVVLREVHRKLKPFAGSERELWNADQRLNDRGIKVDIELARLCEEANQANVNEALARMGEITGAGNPNSTQQILAWITSQGVSIGNLRSDSVQNALSGDLPEPVREVLELRLETALVAAKKFTAALQGSNSDGRVRGQFQFFGAHTGRWSGRGVQLQNLARHQADHPEAVACDLKLGFGASSQDIKGLVRHMFVGPFTVADYAAIEARVIAWMAGERWALDAFAAGRDIYVETAKQLGPQYTRQHGKVAVLALGYNGGPDAMRRMGGEGTDRELKRIVDQWRKTNSNIVNFWAELEDSFRYGGKVGGKIEVIKEDSSRWVRLPSGRAVGYHGIRLGSRLSYADSKGGFRVDTYGGRLAENITQAVARDVLAEAAILRLDAMGYAVVGHVHDEVIVEGEHSEIEEIITQPLPWSDGLPLAAEQFIAERYKK